MEDGRAKGGGFWGKEVPFRCGHEGTKAYLPVPRGGGKCNGAAGAGCSGRCCQRILMLCAALPGSS